MWTLQNVKREPPNHAFTLKYLVKNIACIYLFITSGIP
jgi:hypothetical protein